MSVQKLLNPSFEVKATVSYVAAESRPETGYHLFSYHISIKNNSSVAAQLISRHWIIVDSVGQTEEVRGAGVVGLQPRINPGQVFEYESACPLPTPVGSMKGYYQLISDEGDQFDIEIPEFFLVAPSALH